MEFETKSIWMKLFYFEEININEARSGDVSRVEMFEFLSISLVQLGTT